MADDARNVTTENNDNTDNLTIFVKNLENAWNGRELDNVLNYLGDDVSIGIASVMPGLQETYRGKDQVRRAIHYVFSSVNVDFSDIQVDGDEVSWLVTARSQYVRNMGIDPAQGTATALVDNDKIREMTFTLTVQTQDQLRARGYLGGQTQPQSQAQP